MRIDQILEIFKAAITPEYQQYFEVNTVAKSIRFTQYVTNLFNNYDDSMFNCKLSVLAYIANATDVVYFKFYFEEGYVNCKVEAIDSDVTVELLKEILDDTVKFIWQTVDKYKKRKQRLIVKQFEEI